MPKQNRVTPWGEIIATPSRGMLMGNRGGCFHDAMGRITTARWKSARWIACLLEFKGRWRAVMTPGRYTELFFLDEATALAAGHRPCAECRRPAFNRFKTAWLHGNPERGISPGDSIEAIDRLLHGERVNRRREKITWQAPIERLPNGVFIALGHSPAESFLLWDGALLRWTPGGYRDRHRMPRGSAVDVLTPLSIVRAIAAGYAPEVHPTVLRPAISD